MEPRLGIIEVDHQSDQTLLVNFSDGTYASFFRLSISRAPAAALPR